MPFSPHFPADDQPHHKTQMVDLATSKPLRDKMNIHFLELRRAEK